jgi:hypothetical protein
MAFCCGLSTGTMDKEEMTNLRKAEVSKIRIFDFLPQSLLKIFCCNT